VRLTGTESDNKRLLVALVLACGLYGALLVAALVVRFPDVRISRNPYRAISISLLPPGKPEPVRTEEIEWTKEAERTPERVEPRREAEPLAAGSLVTARPSEPGVAADTASAEIAFSGETSGELDLGAGETAVLYLAAQGPDDPAAAAKARFLTWLDAEIRDRLAYPDKARRRNIEGVVTVRLSVPADGSSCDVVVTGGSGSTLLDRAAVDLVRSLFPADISPGEYFTDFLKIEYHLLGDRKK